MKAWSAALEQYYADNLSQYPNGTCNSATALAAYLPGGIPTDPKNSSPYIYNVGSCVPANYCICAKLESGSGNSGTNACGSGTGFFCVRNQQ